jgi:hypothetical protein
MKKYILIVLALALLSAPSISKATPVNVAGDTNKILNTGSMWNGFEFGRPGVYETYFNYFHSYTAGDWTITTTETGSSDATELIADASGGILRVTNDNSASGDADGLQLSGESFLPASGITIYCETRIKVSSATTGDYLWGLVVTDTSPLAHANGIVFRKNTGDTAWDFETTASSVSSTDSNIEVAQTSDFVKLGFKVNGISSLDYYVDDSKIGTFTGNIPVTEMRPTVYIAGQSVSIDVDNILCAQSK